MPDDVKKPANPLDSPNLTEEAKKAREIPPEDLQEIKDAMAQALTRLNDIQGPKTTEDMVSAFSGIGPTPKPTQPSSGLTEALSGLGDPTSPGSPIELDNSTMMLLHQINKGNPGVVSDVSKYLTPDGTDMSKMTKEKEYSEFGEMWRRKQEEKEKAVGTSKLVDTIGKIGMALGLATGFPPLVFAGALTGKIAKDKLREFEGEWDSFTKNILDDATDAKQEMYANRVTATEYAEQLVRSGLVKMDKAGNIENEETLLKMIQDHGALTDEQLAEVKLPALSVLRIPNIKADVERDTIKSYIDTAKEAGEDRVLSYMTLAVDEDKRYQSLFAGDANERKQLLDELTDSLVAQGGELSREDIRGFLEGPVLREGVMTRKQADSVKPLSRKYADIRKTSSFTSEAKKWMIEFGVPEDMKYAPVYITDDEIEQFPILGEFSTRDMTVSQFFNELHDIIKNTAVWEHVGPNRYSLVGDFASKAKGFPGSGPGRATIIFEPPIESKKRPSTYDKDAYLRKLDTDQISVSDEFKRMIQSQLVATEEEEGVL